MLLLLLLLLLLLPPLLPLLPLLLLLLCPWLPLGPWLLMRPRLLLLLLPLRLLLKWWTPPRQLLRLPLDRRWLGGCCSDLGRNTNRQVRPGLSALGRGRRSRGGRVPPSLPTSRTTPGAPSCALLLLLLLLLLTPLLLTPLLLLRLLSLLLLLLAGGGGLSGHGVLSCSAGRRAGPAPGTTGGGRRGREEGIHPSLPAGRPTSRSLS